MKGLPTDMIQAESASVIDKIEPIIDTIEVEIFKLIFAESPFNRK